METNSITYAWQDVKYDWQARSLCRRELKFDEETGTYVPYSNSDFYTDSGKTVTDEVKNLCERCPVHDECLEHALVHEKYGYWYSTEKEREVLRRKRGIIYRSPQSNSWMS